MLAECRRNGFAHSPHFWKKSADLGVIWPGETTHYKNDPSPALTSLDTTHNHKQMRRIFLTVYSAGKGLHRIVWHLIEVVIAYDLRAPDLVLVALLQSTATNGAREARVVEYRS